MSESNSQLRWLLKKAARQVVATSSLALGQLDSEVTDEPKVRVLTYHQFGHGTRTPFRLAPECFEQHVAYLARTGRAISLEDFRSYLAGDFELSNSKVLLTIDDGRQCTFDIALPILEKYGIPSVAFISPGLISDGSEQKTSLDYMSWSDVEKTENTGMTIGSHAMTHTSYGELELSAAVDDARLAKARLEQHLSYPVDTMAYPYGTRADYSESLFSGLSDVGYELAFTSQHGAIDSRLNRLELPRIKIESGESLAFFQRLVRGSMDQWHLIDKVAWRLQDRKQ